MRSCNTNPMENFYGKSGLFLSSSFPLAWMKGFLSANKRGLSETTQNIRSIYHVESISKPVLRSLIELVTLMQGATNSV